MNLNPDALQRVAGSVFNGAREYVAALVIGNNQPGTGANFIVGFIQSVLGAGFFSFSGAFSVFVVFAVLAGFRTFDVFPTLAGFGPLAMFPALAGFGSLAVFAGCA